MDPKSCEFLCQKYCIQTKCTDSSETKIYRKMTINGHFSIYFCLDTTLLFANTTFALNPSNIVIKSLWCKHLILKVIGLVILWEHFYQILELIDLEIYRECFCCYTINSYIVGTLLTYYPCTEAILSLC